MRELITHTLGAGNVRKSRAHAHVQNYRLTGRASRKRAVMKEGKRLGKVAEQQHVGAWC